LWCIYGGYRILVGLIGMAFLRAIFARHFMGHSWMFDGPWGSFGGPMWVGAVMPVIAGFTVIASVLAFLTGWSLLARKPWGRTLAIVVSILALLKFPFGTALGIYTLWVLAPSASGMEYNALADRS
jgi:hypothetical protein